MIKRILLGLGGTPYTDVAIERAIELAKEHGARITAVTVVDTKRLKQIGPLPPGGDAFAQKLRKKRLLITELQIQKAIAKFRKKCEKFGISTKVKRETGLSDSKLSRMNVFG